MVERLYGVEHGISMQMAGVRISESLVAPSKGLLRDLLSQPQGTKVGIEFTPEFTSPFQIDEVEIKSSPSAYFYWRRIIRACQMRKLDIVYLEDFPTYKRFTRKLMEATAYDQILFQNFLKDDSFLDNEKGKELERKKYIAEVEKDYIFVVEREEKILERIAQTQPNIVILGKGHTDYLIQNKKIPASMGISVDSYQTEDVSPIPWHWERQQPFERAFLRPEPKPDANILKERELIMRKYRALTDGKVIVDGKPDFVGTWDLNCLPRGLFEMYVEGKNFSGIIEDTLGTASFAGQIGEDGIMFAKNYDLNKSAQEASKHTIVYLGGRIGEQYEGTFESPEDKVTGKFTLRRP